MSRKVGSRLSGRLEGDSEDVGSGNRTLVEVGSAGGSRGPIVFPVLLGRSRIQSYTRTHSMGTAIATGNARCLITLSGRKTWALGGAGADRERGRSYIQCRAGENWFYLLSRSVSGRS